MSTQLNWAHWIAGQCGVIPLSLGMPGVAKTASHESLAKATNREFFPVMLDQMLPEDLGGYPVVRKMEHPKMPPEFAGTDRITIEQYHSRNHDRNNAKVTMQAKGLTLEFDVMRRIHDEKFIRARLVPSIMLIDELTNVGHAVQAAALQLMQSGIEGCWIFAAANPIEQAAAGVELSPPMVNRLCVLEWEHDEDAHDAGSMNGLAFPAPTIPVVEADYMSYHHRWGALRVAFHRMHPETRSAFPKDIDKASSPYPSPRAWTNVERLLAAAESVGADATTQRKIVDGCVGRAASTQFWSWISEQNLPDPEGIIGNPASLKLPLRGDLSMAIIGSVLGALQRNCTNERWEAVRHVLAVAYGQRKEIAMAASSKLWRLLRMLDDYQPEQENNGGVIQDMEREIAGVGQEATVSV
jgi:hypothetical protein